MKHLINGKRATSNDEIIKLLDSLIKEGDSLLDLGCGPKLYSTPFKDRCSKVVTVDAWDSVNPDIVADLENADLSELVNSEKFDFVLMLDFIEHLDKDKGNKLIENVKKLTKKKIVLLTPLEEIWDDNHKNVNDPSLWCYGNTYDYHKSVWTTNEFVDNGWQEIKFKSLQNYFVGIYSND